MADIEVSGSASPVPSDHKRRLDDLDSEPFDQPLTDSNDNPLPATDGDGDRDAATIHVKRPRIDINSDSAVEVSENGHQEEKIEDTKEDVTEQSDVIKKNELDGDQVKDIESLDAVNKDTATDEPLNVVNSDFVTDDLHANAVKQQSAENLEESAKEEHPEFGEEQQDPTQDVASIGDVSFLKEQLIAPDQPTSRKMEVPNNKVGVLIGKAGDTIRTLQNSSGARIQITRDSEADPNSSTRPVEILGTIENINKAERLIKEVIAEADAGGSPSLVARGYSAHSSGFGEQLHIQVPNDKVGVIIGKGGETIKNLQARTGARIQLIPQHLPEGDQSKERTVRISGDRRQIEEAKEMIKEVMDQPIRSSTPSGGFQQNFRPLGSGVPHWGPRGGGHPSQQTGYNNYPPRGSPYPSQNSPYSSQGYGNYPPQQPPPKNNYGWDQRPPTNMQGPPEQTGYAYYSGHGHGGHMAPPTQPPMHSHVTGPAMGQTPQGNYNYGPPQGPNFGQQQASYPHTAPQGGGYGQGYGEARYDQPGPGQHPYGSQGSQPSTYPQGGQPGYGQQDQYGKPPAYNTPQPGSYGQPYGQPRQQSYPASSVPAQQGYSQYGTTPAPVVNDGYNHTGAAPGGYGHQSGQAVPGYGQTGGQQPAPSYGQAAPTAGYGQYPSAQPGYTEQVAPNSGGYGYQGSADPAYGGGGGPGVASYGAPPPVLPAYSQPGPAPAPVQPAYSQPGPAPVPVQPGYDQQTGGYMTPQPQQQQQQQQQPQPGYGQYDGSQMYAAHR